MSSKKKKKIAKKKNDEGSPAAEEKYDDILTLPSADALQADGEADDDAVVKKSPQSPLANTSSKKRNRRKRKRVKSITRSANAASDAGVAEGKSEVGSPNGAPSNSFTSVQPPLSPSILRFLSTTPYNFPTPTPVQSTTIPLFLTHHDVFVRAVTGSGKTLAFLIPVVEMILRRTTLLKKRQIGALILEPTRELARQTYRVCEDLCGACGMNKPLLLVGGGCDKNSKGGGVTSVSAVSQDLHQFAIKQSDIVVGTPGRVEDILTRFDNVDVSELEVLILDESDVLLDMGFEVTLTSILGRLPRMRRTGLFSATNTSGVKRLCVKSGMRNPVVVDVAISMVQGGSGKEKRSAEEATLISKHPKQQQQMTPSTLTNFYLLSPLDEKLSHLLVFLRQHSSEKVIVFFLTCACVDYYGTVLKQLELPSEGYEYETLHGKLTQKRREKAMQRFRECQLNTSGDATTSNIAGSALLCTDVASRGLDVPDVSWTIQFDAPVDPASYVHRVGRSARAGRMGNSLVFLTSKEEAYVDFLRLRKVPVRELSSKDVYRSPSAKEELVTETNEEGMKEQGSEDDHDGSNESVESEKEDSASLMSTVNEHMTENHTVKNTSGPGALVADVLPSVRKLALKDRDILEKGTKAFTSYIRAYKEHHCGFIFRFASLDLGLLATSFSLLRLPKMPELRNKKLLNFMPAEPEINIHAIPFKDRVREAARQKRLVAERAAGGKNAKQIKAERRSAERLLRQKERRAAEIAKGRNPNRKKGRQAKIFDEWHELAKEERLYKKLRMHKISREQYETLMYGDVGKKEDLKESCDDDDSD